ncbi:PDR/VanB family oxidoreductase [Hydrogenophaga taeniospiralis]|uniref:PDR/VanB family oxidoreductase n=1 Tax=Hydrogenophaga taeniospiralis TaxID=65656 RepID=UPI001CFA68D5|nr:PDR/VanB family oxidoreductase [Hydrogenophaga taeniospiralis]UCU94964.1 oxidoreductase [Hydrogenophaga taeniospiralis]
MNANETMLPLRVTRKEAIAKDVVLFELRTPDASSLIPFEAGAHVAVQVPSGAMRHYSLCNDPGESGRYQIAVKRETDGRGGSLSLVDGVNVGDTLLTGSPSNLFGLSDKAKSFILVAGGIGITPMMAMIHSLQAEGLRSFKLYYLAREPETAAFLNELKSPELSGKVVVHHTHGDPARAFDLWTVFEKPIAGAHVYCCGPKRLMDEVKDMTGHWPSSAVHFESFGADTKPHADDKPFNVELSRSATKFQVPANRSILDTLREHSIRVPSSCESGTCGSCKVKLLQGEADHRDLALLPEEQCDHIMVCVSRAKSETLVLDL